MARCRTNNIEFLAGFSERFAAPREVECLTNPLRDRHSTQACRSLNLAVLRVLHNNLQAFCHDDECIRLIPRRQIAATQYCSTSVQQSPYFRAALEHEHLQVLVSRPMNIYGTRHWR